MNATAAQARQQHPRGLWFLSGTEAWERFSYYGMSSLLVLYMLNALFPSGGHAIGLSALRNLLGAPQSDQAFASAVYGFYTGTVYLATVLGGYVADRFLGARRTVAAGALMLCAGHIAMAFDATFVAALLLLIAGTGLLKGNISAQVGALYPGAHDGDCRARGFVIFSTGINLGAFVGPIVCGALAQAAGWHYGFGAAAALMLLALVIYASGFKFYAPEPPRGSPAERAPLNRQEVHRCFALIAAGLLTVPVTASYMQIGNVMLVWVDTHVELSTAFGRVPTAWFSSIDPLASMICAPFLLALFAAQQRAGREWHALTKIAIGAAIMAACWLVLAVPAALWPAGKVSVLWPLAACTLAGISFMFYWPPLLALVSGNAPERVRGRMMALTFVALALGNYGVGWIGGWYEPLGPMRFWLMNAGISGLALALLALIARQLARATGE
ncbi:MAG: peptide MFS transporter [Sphingomonadales bacterium]|nr:peptide MFS transporter [Sphingomonadales bacterium]MDE2569532.1 peptide MFS transporter [Sphingomonadales bacterium]